MAVTQNFQFKQSYRTHDNLEILMVGTIKSNKKRRVDKRLTTILYDAQEIIIQVQ